MMKLDAITLDFARQVIEEETGTPLEIQVPPDVSRASAAKRAAGAERGEGDLSSETKLVARDDKKNPLISTFEWTNDATQRIFRVPAGFMRSKTQERIEELARERGAGAIDLALVEEGIEIGKRMMAEMIAGYSAPGASLGAVTATVSGTATQAPAGNGSGYLNEVSPLTTLSASGDQGDSGPFKETPRD
jgi:Proto-chlorophyllide reductase 57 kD subunit